MKSVFWWRKPEYQEETTHTKETADRENRDKNVIIHRVKEMLDDSEDSFFVNTLCKVVLEIGELEVEGITRLGRKKDNHNRLIRVTLKSTMNKRKLMASRFHFMIALRMI